MARSGLLVRALAAPLVAALAACVGCASTPPLPGPSLAGGGLNASADRLHLALEHRRVHRGLSWNERRRR